jgi:hypothetical protein
MTMASFVDLPKMPGLNNWRFASWDSAWLELTARPSNRIRDRLSINLG